MTVQTTTSRADYTGNGVTTAFTVPFYFLDNTHLLVLRTQISTGVTTTLALTTDYSVTGAGVSSGGTVTCVVAPTADQKLSILRNVPLTQLTAYVPNDPFPAASHERALDQLTMEVQQLNEVQNRSLTLSKASTGVSTTLPNPSANLVIGWNPTATGLVNVDANTLSQNIAYGQTKSQTASGDGSTTIFTLSSSAAVANNVQVFIGGVRQYPTTDYTLGTDGVTLTFTAAPPSGTNNILFVWQSALPIGAVPNSSVGLSQFSATGTPSASTYLRGDNTWASVTFTQVYPAAGIAVSTGSAWGTSLTAPSGAIVGTTDTQTLTKKTISGTKETTTVSATAATGTINFDVLTQSVLYYTTNASGNFTLNVRGGASNTLDSIMATGESLTIAFLCTNGATAYYQAALTIDGTSVTPKYQGGSAWASGNASGIDAYVLTIIKTAAATYTVIASQTQFK